MRAKVGRKSDRLPDEIEAEQSIKKNNLPLEEAEKIKVCLLKIFENLLYPWFLGGYQECQDFRRN